MLIAPFESDESRVGTPSILLSSCILKLEDRKIRMMQESHSKNEDEEFWGNFLESFIGIEGDEIHGSL